MGDWDIMGYYGRQWAETVIRGKIQAVNRDFPQVTKRSKDRLTTP
jgi:hypothetical protein